MQSPLSADSPSPVIRVVLSSLVLGVGGKHCHEGKFMPCSQPDKGRAQNAFCINSLKVTIILRSTWHMFWGGVF